MPNYKRAFVPGGTWFFTVNLLQRQQNDLLIREIGLMRQEVKRVKTKHPFIIDAWVVLPDHIHCVWTLPQNDADFSTRWRLIKSGFSRALPNTEYRSKVRIAAGERGIYPRAQVATALLGTLHPRRFRLSTTYRLRACKPAETRLCPACNRLALLVVPSLRGKWHLSRKLVRRCEYGG